ncbi:MAG: 30S ribosome-binding factor RbfA [Rhodothermales bacterium]|nr:30S ribosome-binding factor RbfA [Rhodothermales bacterium]
MSIRTERVGRLIQKEVAGAIGNNFANQIPGFVTVTGCRVTRDLSIAYVYVSIMPTGNSSPDAAFQQILDLSSQIRKVVGSAIRHQLKKVPELKFFKDDSLNEAAKLEAIFETIRDDSQNDDEVGPEDS